MIKRQQNTIEQGNIFAPVKLDVEKRPDGSIILRSLLAADEPVSSVGVWLDQWASRAPDRLFLSERQGKDRAWHHLSYGEALSKVQTAAGWMLENGLGPEHPLAILSDNSIEHAVLALAAMYVGIPVATVSSAYSLVSRDHKRLKSMIELVAPGAIYVASTGQYRKALDTIQDKHDARIIAGVDDGRYGGSPLSYDRVVSKCNPELIEQAHVAVKPDSTARLLFTSGSTGVPKAVINTHRMLTTNQEAKAAVWPFLNQYPPVIVDWLPWSHTFGANHNFNMILRNGGSLYIDSGRPVAGLMEQTVANIKDIGPNLCFNVPRGYAMLVEALQKDKDLCLRFFSKVKIVFYAAAALPQNLWEALGKLSIETVGYAVPMVSAWGATETAPLATDCHFQADLSGNIGLPVPGVELKLVPNAGKLEIRVRGPNVTPGYFRQPELTRKAFDEENFYLIGDAVRFADSENPEKGLFFDGRVAEDFKLLSGTFVSVGQVRIAGIDALAPLAQDIVVTGHDRDNIGFLIFPNINACRSLAGVDADAATRAVLDHPNVRSYIAKGLARLKAQSGGASRYATRARLMEGLPSVDAGEISDKGYINQRAVLANRPDELDKMYGVNPLDYITPG